MNKKTSTPPSRLTVREHEDLIDILASAEGSPLAIARRNSMTLEQLTRWATRPDTAQRVEHARRLADQRATLAIAAARVAAVHALRRWALSTEHPETARRACVDLLKLDPRAINSEQHTPDAAPTDHNSQNTDAIRALLEHLEEHDAPANTEPHTT